jgi:DNA (cytosine-5)-methyltransferase 1
MYQMAICERCKKVFKQKAHLKVHMARKNPCLPAPSSPPGASPAPSNSPTKVDLSLKSVEELIALCKERGVKGYSGKRKEVILGLLEPRPLQVIAKPKYKVLSLFSGMGGMDVGFAEQVVVHKNSVQLDYIRSENTIPGFVNLKRLPFETVFQNDILPEAKRICEINGWASTGSIGSIGYQLNDIRDLLKDNFPFPTADIITGGFPCQDFSHAGKRKGFDSNRGNLYQSFVELVRRVKPIMFVAENVNGLLTMPGDPINKIMEDFAAVGYEVKYQLIKCEEFGIPQTRWRVIIMGLRWDKRGLLPSTYNDWNLVIENKRACHIGHYLRHLVEPEVSEDPAQQVYSKAALLAKGQGQKEVGMNEFAPTIRAEHHGNIEFRRITGGQNEFGLPQRRLSLREAALMQTFPPQCILTDVKKTSKAYKPIGNAVPPLLGYIIARKVQQILESVL